MTGGPTKSLNTPPEEGVSETWMRRKTNLTRRTFLALPTVSKKGPWVYSGEVSRTDRWGIVCQWE